MIPKCSINDGSFGDLKNCSALSSACSEASLSKYEFQYNEELIFIELLVPLSNFFMFYSFKWKTRKI